MPSERCVLSPEKWSKLGAEVAACAPYLPAHFDVAPRNIALKISSGYKAKEYLTLLFCLAPALFKKYLPADVWECFTLGVNAMRIFLTTSGLTRTQVKAAHRDAVEFVGTFERIFYQRDYRRLHYCRQSLHQFLHAANTILRVGPLWCYSQ